MVRLLCAPSPSMMKPYEVAVEGIIAGILPSVWPILVWYSTRPGSMQRITSLNVIFGIIEPPERGSSELSAHRKHYNISWWFSQQERSFQMSDDDYSARVHQAVPQQRWNAKRRGRTIGGYGRRLSNRAIEGIPRSRVWCPGFLQPPVDCRDIKSGADEVQLDNPRHGALNDDQSVPWSPDTMFPFALAGTHSRP